MFKHVRREGGADSFDVKNLNKRIYVCELYFKDKDLRLLWVEEKRKSRPGEFLQYSKNNQ